MRDPDGVFSNYYYDDSGKLFAFDKGGARYYVATDQVGTPKIVSDAAGNIVKYLEFDSFGFWTFDSDPDFGLPVGFAGGLIDTDTQLVRFGYRDYEPQTGRWTAKDPIFFKGGLNLFGYVGNNPLTRRDPSGLEWCNGSYQYSEEELKAMEEKAGTTGESMLEASEFVSNLFENPVLINGTTDVVAPIIQSVSTNIIAPIIQQ